MRHRLFTMLIAGSIAIGMSACSNPSGSTSPGSSVDVTPPLSPTIVGVTDGYLTNQDIKFDLSDLEPGASAEYSTDDGDGWNGYVGQVTLTAEGTYQITARQTDVAGNVSQNAETVTVTIFESPAVITITNPTAPQFSMEPRSVELQTGGGDTQVAVTVESGADSVISTYQWFLNGSLRGSSATLVLDTESSMNWFRVGVNTLTLVVEIDDASYSDDFFFTVEQF